MTASQASHLIEQFASQCPLAIWILDPKGIAIFANTKLQEIFEIEGDSSSAIGVNIMKLPIISELHLEKERDRLADGEPIALTVNLENPSTLLSEIGAKRQEPISLRVVAYALKSSTQTIEHFVFFLEDTTATTSHHTALQEQTHDIQTFMRSKESRKEGLDTLKERTDELRKKIRDLGEEPEL